MQNSGSPNTAPPRVQQVGMLLAALLFSLGAIRLLGRLGFHLEDLSIPFDGGYRIFLGQLPFVDFVAPIGPVLFLQQGLFFALLGVGLHAFLVHAAVLNALAGWMVWRLLWGRGQAVALASGAATLAWFYLPPAAPYIDTTAFFWILVALFFLARTREQNVDAWLVAAGFAAGLAFLTKQNIGGLGIAGIAFLLLLHDRRPLRSALFSFAAVTPLLLLSLFALVTGGWGNFLEYFWQVPLESGRLKYILPWALRMVIRVVRPDLVNSEFFAMAGPAVREVLVYSLCAGLAWRWWSETERERRFSLALTTMLLLIQQWSFNTSNNDEPLYWPFAGLLLGLLWSQFAPTRAGRGLWVLTFVVGFAGLWVGGSRTIHSVNPVGLTFEVEHPRLAGLRLAEQDGESLHALLDFANENIPPSQDVFVLGHSTFLYGVMGHEPPQPLLWFRRGVSYSKNHPEAADDRIVRAIERRGVQWILLDPVGSQELLADFPGLSRSLEDRFREVEAALGSYRVYRRIN